MVPVAMCVRENSVVRVAFVVRPVLKRPPPFVMADVSIQQAMPDIVARVEKPVLKGASVWAETVSVPTDRISVGMSVSTLKLHPSIAALATKPASLDNFVPAVVALVPVPKVHPRYASVVVWIRRPIVLTVGVVDKVVAKEKFVSIRLVNVQPSKRTAVENV